MDASGICFLHSCWPTDDGGWDGMVFIRVGAFNTACVRGKYGDVCARFLGVTAGGKIK